EGGGIGRSIWAHDLLKEDRFVVAGSDPLQRIVLLPGIYRKSQVLLSRLVEIPEKNRGPHGAPLGEVIDVPFELSCAAQSDLHGRGLLGGRDFERALQRNVIGMVNSEMKTPGHEAFHAERPVRTGPGTVGRRQGQV